MAIMDAHWRYSNVCNLNCEFCFALPNICGETMDDKKIVDELVNAGFGFLTFTGGEPTLRRKDLIKIIPYAYKKGLKLGLDTNGCNLDNRLMRVLKENKVLLGLPLYSVDAETHNQLVKSDHHSTIISLLGKAKELGVSTKINTMVSKKNKNSVLGMGKIIEKYDVSYWNILKFMPYRKAINSKEKHHITEEEFLNIIRTVRREHPLVKVTAHSKDENSQEGYFFVEKDGTVIQPIQNSRERKVGSLKKQTATKLLRKINTLDNERRTTIERIVNEGII